MSSSAADLLANEAFLRRLARNLAADDAGADDLVQETWLAALKARPFDRSGLRSWLARVLRNLAVTALRGRVRREAREGACPGPDSQPDTAELVERMELHRRLVASVLGLPEAYREVILRYYFRGESVHSMAVSLRKPEATVRTRLRRAREHLRRELGGRLAAEHGAAFATLLGTLEPTTRWTSELVMRKALIQTPLIVSGVLGASLGFGGSLLVRGEPAVEPSGNVGTAELAEASAAPPSVRAPEREQPLSPAPPPAPARSPIEPGRGAPRSMTELDLRRLLLSSDRLDQVRAIRLLQEAGTREAHALLLETFLSARDGILLALLEEAVLASGMDVSEVVFESYLSTRDPERLRRLTSMLQKLVLENPGLEPRVVELFMQGLRDLDGLTAFLSDPHSDPRGVQAAAFALVKIDPSAAEDVRQRLGETFDSLIEAVGDETLSDEQRRALLERTSSMAWAASSRPEAEHDALSAMLAERLFHARDQQQAQTLAWGITSLKGLSAEARAGVVSSILDALAAQASSDLRQTYLWAVSQLATDHGNRALDRSFFDIEQMVEAFRARHGSGPAFAAQLDWLWRELQAHREKKRS